MSQYKVVTTHPVTLPDGTTAAPGELINADPDSVTAMVGEGHLVATSTPVPPPETVPDGNVDHVVQWIGDDPARAQAALDVEKAGENRKGVIHAAEQLIATTAEETR